MSLRNRATPAKYCADITGAPDYRISGPDVAARPPLTLQRKSNAFLTERLEALTCALTQPCVVRWEAPAELVNRGNGSQGVSVKGMHARAASRKAQRALGERIARQFAPSLLAADSVGAFAVVVLTRIAPRQLDTDGLEFAFKSVRDGIATGLGIDDRSSLVRYVTSQEQGAPRYCAVRAELFIQPKSEAP